MQTRKRISDLPWFILNDVFAWIDYKKLFDRVLLEVVSDRHCTTGGNHIYNLEKGAQDRRLRIMQWGYYDYEDYNAGCIHFLDRVASYKRMRLRLKVLKFQR